jgi:hypothetical protein
MTSPDPVMPRCASRPTRRGQNSDGWMSMERRFTFVAQRPCKFRVAAILKEFGAGSKKGWKERRLLRQYG